ncbi:hypothetical protein FACS189451_01810 [Bacteroidia bacterium]|nr:hypothetical protein FACS189446_5820 [Bacteroidia bacterium]GHT60892.1 hypothetical protein FACS189451_01810 [Bacteroidia bacterium]
MSYNQNHKKVEQKIILTEKEKELIEAIRNLKRSRHNYSYQLEEYVRELFDKMVDEIIN